MNYQDLFIRAGITQTKKVLIEGFGEIVIKKPDAALALEREQLILEKGKKGKNGELQVAPILFVLLTLRHCVLDEQNQPFLTDEMLMKLPSDTLYAIYAAVSDFDGGAESADETAKKS